MTIRRERHDARRMRDVRRSGFTLIEIIIAMVILSGSLLGFAAIAQKFTRMNGDILNRTVASELATARIEQIKGARAYSSLVPTYNGVSETWTGTSDWSGFTRNTIVARTGPTVNNDYVTVTVVVSGRSLISAVRRTTSIAAF
jgi:prepilin-type N-terminal cleavage/methylation domain-containing protein